MIVDSLIISSSDKIVLSPLRTFVEHALQIAETFSSSKTVISLVYMVRLYPGATVCFLSAIMACVTFDVIIKNVDEGSQSSR